MTTMHMTARENPAPATNGGRHIPTVRDARRKALNALETLRVAALEEGDQQMVLHAECTALMLKNGARAQPTARITCG